VESGKTRIGGNGTNNPRPGPWERHFPGSTGKGGKKEKTSSSPKLWGTIPRGSTACTKKGKKGSNVNFNFRLRKGGNTKKMTHLWMQETKKNPGAVCVKKRTRREKRTSTTDALTGGPFHAMQAGKKKNGKKS